MIHEQFDVFDQILTRACCCCETGNHIPLFSPKQLIDRDVERFSGNIIQRDVNGTLCREKHAPAFEILASVKFLPDPPYLQGILANQEFTEVLQGPMTASSRPLKPDSPRP